MDNPELGMLAIKRIEAEPKTFRMSTWGRQTDCGTKACLAGHVMLAAGYILGKGGFFYRPDGSIVFSEGREAYQLLGMSWAEQDLRPWNDIRSDESALAMFREMVEKSMAE